MMSYLMILLVALCTSAIQQVKCSVETDAPSSSKEFYSIVVPGQNGCGGESFITHGVVNTEKWNNYGTLSEEPWKIDLGQGNCMRHFEEQCARDENFKQDNNIWCGVSQGTATLVNSLAQKPHEQQEKITKCLVLEAVLGHGNSAILQTVSNVPIVTYLPFARFWIPWVAKLIYFPTYNPYGKQVFSSAKNLSPNIPVVIMHDKNDFQLSINDARETYCALQSRKNNKNNAYLMEVEDPDGDRRHFNILRDNPAQQAALQAIYQRCNLPYRQDAEISGIDLSPYQPSVQEVRARIRQSTWRGFWKRNIIDLCAAAAIFGGIYLKYFKKSV